MSAILSPCGQHRYRLERHLGEGPTVAILGVNPSTADATVNDATIRKDIGFSRIHGWGRLVKGNLFTLRATDVKELGRRPDVNGPDADKHLREIVADADVVVCAWGPKSKLPRPLRQRWIEVVHLIECARKVPMVFGLCGDGQPRHTLMIAYDSPLRPWPEEVWRR